MADVKYSFTDPDGQVISGSIHVTEGDASKPLILLLHGDSGDINDMSDPATHPQNNYDYSAPFPADKEIGWKWYPGIGPWSFLLDVMKPVTGWQPVLTGHGFRCANYTQIDNSGLLARPVLELTAIVQALLKAFPTASLVFLAHSRGGLLVRKFIKDNQNDPTLAGRISFIITLHSPHQGSDLANVANALDAAITALATVNATMVMAAFGWLASIVHSPSFQELAVGSPFLTTLSAGETAMPGVAYHSFGGISVRLTRLLSWFYTLGSAFPQWHLPPYDHWITMVELPGSPVLNSLPPLAPEIIQGQGDMLVADGRAHLPFSIQHTNSLNHAEALWDPSLQAQVLSLLGQSGGIWG